MAKKGNRVRIILESEEPSKHRYHTEKNKLNTADKIQIRNYDPMARKMANYKEKKGS